VASLSGVRSDVTYEAQAAIEMEVLSKPFIASAEAYVSMYESGSAKQIKVKDIIQFA
jgi:hydrogenase maturation factor HypF (carbamoyltransferase family)